ncbi:MAG: oxidoreductase, partial [Proteobacteria bacterium]
MEGRTRRLSAALPGLREALAQAPDPARAQRLAESVLEAGGDALATALAAHPAGAVRALASLCGVAP